ncbi:MAG TPA: hypothetical protein VGG28_23030 [Kofleriaceae bacterium]|jgi:hypothetical protein
MKHLLFASALMLATGAIGCYDDDQQPQPQYAGQGAPGGDADDGGADLVEVSPGVEVIADYDEPIFFADDLYWVNRGGFWYSSTWYGGGWGRNYNPPGHILGISRPDMYRHYRPAGYVAHEHVRGGYAAHAQYHASHPVGGGGVHVRAAVHGGGGHHR